MSTTASMCVENYHLSANTIRTVIDNRCWLFINRYIVVAIVNARFYKPRIKGLIRVTLVKPKLKSKLFDKQKQIDTPKLIL